MYPLNFLKEIHSENESLVFVVMPFSHEYNPIYENLIKPAVTMASEKLAIKLETKRADEARYTREGWTDVLRHIFSARLIIGVLTDYNPNVFYELGIAHSTRPLTKQILISENEFKQCFDTKDIIQLQFPRFDPGESVDELCENIVSTINQSLSEDELSVQIAEASLGALELNLIEDIWKGTKNSHFVIQSAEVHNYQALTNLCRVKLVRLSTKVWDTGELERSWYWTPLGIRLLKKWNKIDEVKAKKWIADYRKFFGTI